MIKKITGQGRVLKVKRAGGAETPIVLSRKDWSVENELKWQVDEFRRLYKEGERQKRQAEQIGEASPFPLLLLDADGLVDWCNPAGSELLLPPGVDLTGKRLLLFVTPGSFTAFRAQLLACLQGETKSPAALAVRRQDGAVRQLIVDMRRIEAAAENSKPRVLLAAFDYTDGLAREVRVRRQNQALLQLSERLLDGSRITGRKQILQAVLAGVLEMTGGSCAYWRYRDADERQQVEALRWPGDKSRILIDTVAVRARQKNQAFFVSDYQAWPAKLSITPYGSVEAAIAVLADLSEEETGELVVFSLSPDKKIDATDAVLLEKVIRMARFADESLTARLAARQFVERDRRVHQLTGLGSFFWDVGAKKTQWDDLFAKLTGLDHYGNGREDGCSDLLKHVLPADLRTLQQMLNDWRNGLPDMREIRFIGTEGSERWVQLTGEVVGDLRETPAISAVALDITPFKHAEMECISAVRQTMEKLQNEQVMSTVVRLTDCLASPVSRQQQLTEQIMQRAQLSGDEGLLEQAGQLKAWAAQTNYQLRRLRAYSYYGIGVSLDQRKSDIGALVSEWLAWQDSRIKAAGVTVDWRRTLDETYAMLDQRRFTEALTELLDNALESFAIHAVAAPTLTIRLTKQEQQLELLFQDNGAGFSSEQLQNSFQPFQTSGDDGRLGIGLSMVRHIISLNQGSVSIGRAANGGAAVTIMLPAA